MTLETISIRVDSARVHGRPDADPQKHPAMVGLLHRAEANVTRLRQWNASLPAAWARTTIDASFSPDMDNIEQYELWSGPLATYRNLNVAHYHNLNRNSQLYAGGCALRAAWWLDTDGGRRPSPSGRRVQGHLRLLQSVIDDVCADVPFYLGLTTLPPELAHLRIAQLGLDGRGGVSLWCWLFNSMSVEVLPEPQRRWMRSRMLYIGDTVKYKWASFLAVNTSQTLIFDAQPSQVRSEWPRAVLGREGRNPDSR